MTASILAHGSGLLRGHWRVVVLLVLSVFINYIDRSNLAIAAPLLKDEFGFSASQLGVLFSAFFWTYACFQLVSGWLVDRFDVSWVMAAGFFLWSAATAATGLLQGFAAFLAIRMILGMGESVAYPSYSKIIGRCFPEARRGLPNALIMAGLSSGPALGMLFGGILMARFGWRPFFLGLGFLSMAWLVPWLWWKPPASRPVLVCKQRVALTQIVRQPSFWGTSGGLFCGNYLNYFLLMWLPYYLVRERHFSMQQMAVIGALMYGCGALCSTASGWMADRWITAGATATLARKTFAAGGMTAGAVLAVACIFAGPGLSVVLLVLLGMAWTASGSNLWAVTQTLAGPQAVGRWAGTQNFLGNLAGIMAPAVTGIVVDRSGHFGWALVITAAVTLAGAGCWIFVVGRVEPVEWGTPAVAVRAAGISADAA